MIEAKVNGSATRGSAAETEQLKSSNGGGGNGRNGGNGTPANGDSGQGGGGLDGAAADSGGLSTMAVSNLAFAEDLYYQFLRDPSSVDAVWRATFQAMEERSNGSGALTVTPPSTFARSIFAPSAPAVAAGNPVASRTSVRLLSERVQRLVEGYRELGHLSADLDPLGLVKRGGGQLRLEDFGLAEEDLDLVFSSENVAGPNRTTLRDLVELLRETYTRQIGVELAHLHDMELRGWLQNRMESTRNRLAMTRADRRRVLDQVIGAEVFEQFLQIYVPQR